MPLGEPTTWQQEMGGGGPRPRLDTLIQVIVAVVLAAALLAALPRSSSTAPDTHGRVGPGCVEAARLEAHGVTSGRALAGARQVCARERKAADADISGVHP